MLQDVVRWQQQKHIRKSIGELANECFTDADFAAFRAGDIPRQIVTGLRKTEDFKVIAAELRKLSPDRLTEAVSQVRRIARPTWRQMGFIDREGRGQTEAGHQAELMIAAAIVDAFSAEVQRP